jgi:hypothetical protein
LGQYGLHCFPDRDQLGGQDYEHDVEDDLDGREGLEGPEVTVWLPLDRLGRHVGCVDEGGMVIMG